MPSPTPSPSPITVSPRPHPHARAHREPSPSRSLTASPHLNLHPYCDLPSYNLSVPAAWQQVHRLQPNKELLRALCESPQRAEELRAERGSRRAMAEARSIGDGAAGTAFTFAGGQPTFALREGPIFPNFFEALSSAIMGKT